MKISEVISKLEEFHEPFTKNPGCRDMVLAGDSDQECTGIMVTVCATQEVLEKAVAAGKNLIISHESIFFGGQIDKDGLDENPSYIAKNHYIYENKLCIWRDHDHMHGNGPPFFPKRTNKDYIFYGIMKELGWEKYVFGDKLKPLWYEIPTMKGYELADLLISKFNLNGLRVVGDLDTDVSVVWLSEHVQGGKMDGDKVSKSVRADAIIPFEICDYTVTQYVHDSCQLGMKKVILEMGHFNAEEIGMKYMAEWLPQAINCEDIPVEFVQSGDFFQYYRG